MLTLVGSEKLEGELEISLRWLTGVATKMGIHVACKLSPKYDMVIGCDVLGKIGEPLR